MLTACVFLRTTTLAQIHWHRLHRQQYLLLLADSFGRRVLLPLHCIPRCHKNKKHINLKYDNTPFRAIPCFFPALRCAFFELAHTNHSIQKRFTSLGNSAVHPFAGTGKLNNGSVAGEGNPRFPLSSLATCGNNSLHSTLFFYRLK